ncbi:MAG TPA: hypothetical protein VMH89_03525, partial [Candidatus Acidoferrum sp.]|nr:hypothetical protein [Candidatus Acidoferrum sp.]
MQTRHGTRFWKSKGFLCFIAAFFMSILALWMCGGGSYILRSLGWLIVAQDPVAKADIIVVAIDANGAGTLEAADLVHRGVSTQVAVFNDPPGPVDREFIRRGLPY